MAEMPAERTNKGSSWWMWVIGLIILIGIIWLILGTGDEPDAPVEAELGVVEYVEEPTAAGPTESADRLLSSATALTA